MAEWLAHSNQKLYQARLLIEKQEQAEQSADESVLSVALQEAVLFQLVLAYQSYIHEIAELAQYRDTIISLQQLIDSVPVATGEMTELRQLENDKFSWLSQLLTAFDYCAQKENRPTAPQRNAGMIQIFDQTSQSLPLRDWFQALTNIIDLQRNNRQES
jgi:hypothetical protein